MKGRKLFLLTTVLFTFILRASAPVPTEKRINELLNLNRIQIEEQEQEEKRQEELQKFLDAVAYSESRCNPNAYNKYGYIGKYQFGYAARKSCGYGNVTFADFVKNPDVWSEAQQDSAMITLLSKNERHLKDVIHKYNGKVVDEIKISKSGILAAAHLAGAKGVQRYFEKGYNPKDAYGTTLEDYLIRFSGFNL